MYSLKFPYKEGSLNGVFGAGVRKGNSIIKYEVKMSTIYSAGYEAEKCFDGQYDTLCHTNVNNAGPYYLQIRFLNDAFVIEGFGMQNRNIDNHLHPLIYSILGSNDGITFDEVQSYNDASSNSCGSSQIRTKIVSQRKKYSYYRLVTQKACGTDPPGHFNLAEFELFGYFNDHCQCKQTYKRSHIIGSIQYLVFIFCAK